MSEPDVKPRPDRKRGRPRKRATTVTAVRIADEALDGFCWLSIRTGVDVRTLIRRVIEQHAPKRPPDAPPAP